MKIRTFFLLPALAVCSVSCQSLKKTAKRGASDEGANPYDMAGNGGYSNGDYYGNPAASAGSDYSAAYDPGYATAMNNFATQDQAQVVPFTDNGADPYASVAPASPSPAPKPRANPAPTRKPPAVASNSSRSSSSSGNRTTSGTQGGHVVKAVYRPEKKTASTPAKKKAHVQTVHVVKKGDTLTGLSGRYGVSVSSLKKANGLAGDLIRIGQELVIH